MTDLITIDPADVLLVVDPQNDFCPGGSLAVPGGDQIFPGINRIMPLFRHVFASQDWHPRDHQYFQAYGGPWPYHCLQGSEGAEFHPALDRAPIQEVFRKGTDPHLDGYSSFAGTRLAERLRQIGARRIFIAGLATDYCVRATAIEALAQGYSTYVLTDVIRPVEVAPGDGQRALDAMAAAGAHFAASRDLTDQG